jgi:uncharacterized membrane protein
MTNPLIWIILIPVLLLAVLSLVPLFTRPSERPADECWRGGIFYVNPDDPALFVPKRYGIGYTLNFGNNWSWFVMALILLLVLLPVILSVNAVRRIPRFR